MLPASIFLTWASVFLTNKGTSALPHACDSKLFLLLVHSSSEKKVHTHLMDYTLNFNNEEQWDQSTCYLVMEV